MPSIVPFSIVTSGGNPRPIITSFFSGHAMPMMVHSNASLFAQLRHARAAAFGIQLIGEKKNFGIDRPSHVSELGSNDVRVASLRIGSSVIWNAPVSVFEVPQDKYGMLGLRWITHRLRVARPIYAARDTVPSR